MTDDTTLRIERIVDAPPEAVFRAWTTREAMEAWYHDGPDDVVRVVELDVQVGVRYHVEFGPAERSRTSKPACTSNTIHLVAS